MINYKKNSLNTFLFLAIVTIYLISVIQQTWLGEDGFIFLRYAQNLSNGNGLVFNLDERVEGFTSPLWVFLISLISSIIKINLNATVILTSYILSIASIYLLLKDKKNLVNNIPIGIYIIISNSAFIDFSTSGFETPLTFFLISLLCLAIKNNYLSEKPLMSGVIVALLILNRPETALIFIYLLFRKLLKFFSPDLSNKPKLIGNTFKFITPVAVLCIPYQVFRMFYYSSFFPNTFYEKKASYLYIEQGYNYLSDFILSYPVSCSIIFLLISIELIKTKFSYFKIIHHQVFIACTLIAYVLFNGGDYMHGRSLLIPFIFIAFVAPDIRLNFFKNSFGKIIVHILVISFLFLQAPITKKESKEINYVNDERNHFYGPSQFSIAYLSDLLSGEIPGSYGWRDRGLYYKDVANKLDQPITIHFPNIGFFSYAAGNNVNIIGPLIDFYRSKLPLRYRGKVGHEEVSAMQYIFYRRPHFSNVPFPEWRDVASFKYEDSIYSGVISGYSNDSLIPITNLSDKRFINKFSELTGIDIKTDIDNGIKKFLTNFDRKKNIERELYFKELFGFLRFVWYPFASKELQDLFNQKSAITNDAIISRQEYFNLCQSEVSQIFSNQISNKKNKDVINYNNIRFSLETLGSKSIQNIWLTTKNPCGEPFFGFFKEIDIRNVEKDKLLIDLSVFSELRFLPIRFLTDSQKTIEMVIDNSNHITIPVFKKISNQNKIILDLQKLKDMNITTIYILDNI